MIASNRPRKHVFPPRWRAVAVPFFILMVVITSFGIIFEYEHVNEGLEHKLFKGSFLHAFWEEMGGYVRLPEESDLTVFMHVPRTSNDAMRTHLYGSPRYPVKGLIDNSPIWPHEFLLWPTTYLTPALVAKARLPSTKVIKGYFSRRDMIRLNVTKKRTIIFLRHPIERTLSLLKMVHIRKKKGPWTYTSAYADVLASGDIGRFSMHRGKVDCGSHQSDSGCSGCPLGHGRKWCHGACTWFEGQCLDRGMARKLA